jgi:exonuclease I
MPAYHGIDQNPQSPFISVCQHIKASINNSYRRLFRHASISRQSIILPVIANSGSVIYRDIDLKANKHHISYYIRSNRVSRFSILTYLIILHINKCPVLAQPKRHISIPALSKRTMSMRHSLRGKVSI